jgi:hypothetical protein
MRNSQVARILSVTPNTTWNELSMPITATAALAGPVEIMPRLDEHLRRAKARGATV